MDTFEDLYELWSWERSQDMRIAQVTESGFLAVFMCLVCGDIGDTGSAAPSYKDSISLCLPSSK